MKAFKDFLLLLISTLLALIVRFTAKKRTAHFTTNIYTNALIFQRF